MVSRRTFLKIAGVSTLTWGMPAHARDTRKKPNIVYIMADELGYFELSCMGHRNLKTPNIDRMASEGIRFTQALAGSSVCAPTRGCLMTGKHSGHTSVRSNGGGTPLRAEEETIASMLKRAGYATGGFGKWGCGGRGSTGVPEAHGFDVFFGYYDQVHAHTYYPPYLIRNSEEVPLPGNTGGRSGQTYAHYAIMDEAKRFIRANKDRSFFCYLPVTPPHGMFDIPDDDPAWQIFKDEPWPEEAKRYAAMVSMLDRHVGEILDLLKELSLDQDTLVFFCGDNGGQDYFKSQDHPRGFHGPNVHPATGEAFRGQKGSLYEGGLRIPMIARWPGRIEAGRTTDHLCYFPDVMPTLAELAREPAEGDGISIVPELLGGSRKQAEHEYLYWELGQQTAVRMGQWKAIQPKKDRAWELYDLSRDRSEKEDVASHHPQVMEKMKAFAEEAHEPVREGIFHDRADHEKDRRAKGGKKSATHTMPQEGLISRNKYKIVRVSSEERTNGKAAKNAIDGDPRTWWHTEWKDRLAEHPHELVLDLGETRTIRGFRYLPRQDKGWNGTVKKCTFHVSDSPDLFNRPAVEATFERSKRAQEVRCEPRSGRYVLLRTLSAHGDGPWASMAELGVIGE